MRFCVFLSKSRYFLLAVTLMVSSAGCQHLKASPAEPSAFVDVPGGLQAASERSPFQSEAFRNGDMNAFYERRKKCTKLLIRPVRTDFIMERSWWDAFGTFDEAEYAQDASDVAAYFYKRMREEIEQWPGERWKLVEQADEETLVIEYALVELVPTKAIVNAAGTALSFFVPGGGLTSAVAKGSIAFEAKIYDGATGDLLLVFADRESDKTSLVSIADYRYYAHAREAIDDWSEQFAELAHTPKNHQVSDSLPFTLRPW